jgi:hypothetical protein
MGLGANFKKYMSSVFPAHILKGSVHDCDAVVVDVMVLLHVFKVREDEMQPARRLAMQFWTAIKNARCAALCFDVSHTTPAAKQIEWRNRRQPEVSLTENHVRRMLQFDQLDNYADLVSSRKLRVILCDYIVRNLVSVFRAQDRLQNLYIFGTEVPLHYTVGVPDPVLRHDLHKSLHGEADISGMLAAYTMHTECKCMRLKCVTVDTDWVLVGLLHVHLMHEDASFFVELSNFNKGSGFFDIMSVKIRDVEKAIRQVYNVSVFEWASFALTRGCDFVDPLLKFVPDWEAYMVTMLTEYNKRGVQLTPQAIDTDIVHKTIVAASDKTPRAKLNYARGDGALARLAWSMFYFSRAPIHGGADLDNVTFGGWGLDKDGLIQKKACAETLFKR